MGWRACFAIRSGMGVFCIHWRLIYLGIARWCLIQLYMKEDYNSIVGAAGIAKRLVKLGF